MTTATTTNTAKNIIAEPSYESVIYFAPSTLKLSVMSFVTLGCYDLYWWYKNWKALQKTGFKCMPLARTIFATLFVYSFFKKARKHADYENIKLFLPAGLLTILYILIAAMWILPGSYSFISQLAFLPLVCVNRVILALNKTKSENIVNDKFSKWNWVAIILGSICLVLATIGMFLPATTT